jgi:hypothetical protein
MVSPQQPVGRPYRIGHSVYPWIPDGSIEESTPVKIHPSRDGWRALRDQLILTPLCGELDGPQKTSQ